MFFILLGLWFVFNERVTLELLVIGVIISAALCVFCRCLIGRPEKKSLTRRSQLFALSAQYFLFVLKQIFQSNINVLRLIVTPGIEPEPQLHYFRTTLKNDLSRVMLANTITITPGTITCKLENDELCVHTLDKPLADGLVDSEFEKRLLEVEAMANAAE